MRKIMVFAFTATILGLAPLSAGAQKVAHGCPAARRQGPPTLMLLNRQAVRADLKLSDEQARRAHDALVKQITAFVDALDQPWQERRAKRAELRKQSEEAVAQILTPDQGARLKQITLQLQGARAFGDPDVAKVLGITEEQQQQLRAIHAEARKEFAKASPNGRSQGEESWKAIKELQQRTREQALSVLTDVQKTRWQELTGTPIQADLHMGRFGAWRRGQHCQG